MSVPPVVDHAKRALIDDIKSKSFFNVFNVVAVVAILVIGYFLYKKFNEKFKSGAIRLPSMEPKAAEPTMVSAAVEEVGEEAADDKQD